MLRQFLLLLLVGLTIFPVFGQQTAVFTDPLSDYNKAVELFSNSQFLAAQTLFTRVKQKSSDQTIQGDCAYYIASCAVRLNQQNADGLMEAFVADYPTSIKRNEAYINVANYYFENGKYAYARKWFDKVDENALNAAQKEQFYFNNGYAYFSSKRYEEAQKYLNRVSNSEKYGAQSKYYLGYIAYEEEDYQSATEYFEEIKGIDRYAHGLSYYEADMNFKLGNFEKAIEVGLEQFDQSNAREKSELSKIIGESYFNLEQYDEALPYLQGYRGKDGRWSNTDYYQLGYTYYKQGDYQNAIGEFNKIVGGRDEVAQNAYYHLAESYLKLDQKQQALNAFKNASEMNFSAEIQQDAWLNYAKLSYEIGNSYRPVPEVLLSFIDQYPDNANNDELQELLIDSYISSRNYGAALDLLENNKKFENKLAYQKVAFFRGVELFNENRFQQARELFQKSLSEPRDAMYTARATYWIAECDYLQSNFDESLIGYRQFMQLPRASDTPEFENSAYAIGYNQFKLNDYPAAISSFKQYVSKTSAEASRKRDALVRIADSYFVTSDYQAAIDNYSQAITQGTPDQHYAAFQRAISYGFIGKIEEKLVALSQFGDRYPNSIYRDDALYELGNTLVAQDRTQDAIEAYDQLLRQLPESGFVARTLLKKALIYDNGGDSREALRLFKQVAGEFPSTPEALQAVSSAKIIYIDLGEVDEYARWVKTLDFVEVADAELDDAAYQAAERPYLENKPGQAKGRFADYLEQFPNGKHSLKAHFYLAQLQFGDNEKTEAKPHYKAVADRERNEFTEQALARLSEILLSENDYGEAVAYLSRLETVANFPQNVIFAQTNSMKSHYELRNYSEAVQYAEKVLANSKIDNAIKSDAQVIIARSAMETAEEDKARAAYTEVLKIATGQLAAEALYYDAYFKNQDGDFEASNASVQQLARDYSGYKLYGAKGLVLMARNFYGLEDAYQATYILESVIENFAEFPEVVSEARSELAVIKAAQSKTNSSVETDGND
ncbi:tetratricopeptide repeat protein [Aureitalea marina]|uniref:Outer membrane lipoprotein BamD-like domain-containing protein n=1 Tax=Aureitalea marina TaxID=930804 RepID=A0A2S7KQF5_9FLAO|nr:tetratricopeptide repeat protein [Aureitalea marina]PQB04837.1 hypothetical protein BST85_07975 [Aureitalea marina]